MPPSTYHKLLANQVARHLPAELLDQPAIRKFLALVSDTYGSFARDIRLSEHAFTVSEKEYQEVTLRLQRQNHIRHESIAKLKDAIRSLDKHGLASGEDEVPVSEEDCVPVSGEYSGLVSGEDCVPVSGEHEVPVSGEDPAASKEQEDKDLITVISFLEEQIRKTKALETELIKAKEDAEKAARAKSDFLSVMSHEIRTPLNAIIGISHLLVNEDHYPQQEESLTALQISADNLFHLINDILDFSKIEEGKVVFAEKNIDLRKLVTNIKTAYRFRADEGGNKIKLMLDDDLPVSLKGDDIRLAQVLNNLIANAVKFTSNGLITVEVHLNKVNGSTVTIDFSVADTGIGIDKAKQGLIFERFAQANSDITRQFGGSGLGLSIVKKLLVLQHTDIRVESEPGKGSRFSFSLDFKKGDTTRPEENTGIFGKKADLKGIKILLVEDVEFNVLVAEKMLRNWNARVEVASNGLCAVGKMKNETFDIVLMDLQMPVMDGYTAVVHIREFNKATPIVALTASSSMDIQQKAYDCGMTDYLSKPFNPNDLLHTILKYTHAGSK